MILGYLSIVVVVETVWVLQRAYGLTRERVVAVIEAMLQSDVFVIEHEQDVFAATVAVKRDRSQFADALIGRLGERAGCSATLTFDRRAARSLAFRLLL
jgi:predicted nucleic-acid-binding protein